MDTPIENLYQVFAKYRLRPGMVGCPCCVTESDIERLYKKKLRELDAEDLGKYSLKAVTTWGDEYDFKHFLPRILELWDDCVSHDMLFMKLQYLHWETWPPQEKDAIVVYFESILKSLWHEFSQLPDATLGEESSFEAWVIESDIEEISDFLSGKLICEDFTEN